MVRSGWARWCRSTAGRVVPTGKYLARVEKQHGQGQALTVLAHPLARAVYDMWKRGTAFDLNQFLHVYWSRAGEPDANLDCAGSAWHQGLLAGAFRPVDPVCVLQSDLRQPPVSEDSGVISWPQLIRPDASPHVPSCQGYRHVCIEF